MIRLPTDSDIRDAVAWRLSGMPAPDIDRHIERLIACNCDVEAYCRLGNVPPWTTACALAVRAAERVRDVSLFYRSGFEVLTAHRQSSRNRGKGVLQKLIIGILRELPDFGPAELRQEFIRRAEDDDDGIFEYDEELDLLSYWSGSRREESKELSYNALAKRVQRAKKELSGKPGRLLPDINNNSCRPDSRCA